MFRESITVVGGQQSRERETDRTEKCRHYQRHELLYTSRQSDTNTRTFWQKDRQAGRQGGSSRNNSRSHMQHTLATAKTTRREAKTAKQAQTDKQGKTYRQRHATDEKAC